MDIVRFCVISIVLQQNPNKQSNFKAKIFI